MPFRSAKSPDSTVVIGRIVRPIGVKGEVKIIFESGDSGRLEGVDKILVRLPEGCFEFGIEKFQPLQGYARVSLAGVTDMDQAETLRNAELVVSADNLPDLDEDAYYIEQLIGAKVTAEDGEPLGTLREVIEQGHHDIWVVVGDLGEILIPARKEFIAKVDLEAKLVVVKRVEGLWGAE